MEKREAAKLFGNVKKLCDAMEISRNAYYKWDDVLTVKQSDQVRGAYARITEKRDREAVALFGKVK